MLQEGAAGGGGASAHRPNGRARCRVKILEVDLRVPKYWAPRGEVGTDGKSQLLPSLVSSGTELCLPRGKDTFSNSTKSP